MKTTADRFWAKVNKNGPIPAHRPELGPCWVWTGGLYTNGYGEFWDGSIKKLVCAHRYAFKLGFGEVPDGLNVLHHCDNVVCVNYERHLFIGTQLENMRDMQRKGRCPRGRQRYNAILTEDSVREIRVSCQADFTLEARRALARRFGVHPSLIYMVARGKRWGYVV